MKKKKKKEGNFSSPVSYRGLPMAGTEICRGGSRLSFHPADV